GGGGNGGAFDLVAFQREVLRLRLPTQDASVTVHDVDLASDATLSAAFNAAVCDVAITAATAGGGVKSVTRRSINSAVLVQQLRDAGGGRDHTGGHHSGGHHGGGTGNGSGGNAGEAQLVDVFVFSVGGAAPAYIDGHWQARAAAPGLVVAVQSAPLQAEAPLSCDGRPVHFNPRNPLRPVVAAVAELVGGLIPSHLTPCRSGATGRQDWIWAISESPLSALVPHARLGQLHEDVVYRTHAARALAASAQLTSAAARQLSAVPAGPANAWLADAAMDTYATRIRGTVREVWRQRRDVADCVARMAFADALPKLEPLLERSRAALALAEA
ncbi:unnamed protein product, partial [Phaeothamnion confervicola]